MPRSEESPAGVDDGNPFGWRFVTPLYVGSALNPINSSLIATALVAIAAAVHVSVGRTAVLVSALYLASAIAQPTGGKLAEEFGPRRVFLCGICLVGAGGVVGWVGQDMAALIVARVLIGIGTSAGYPSAMLLIRRRAESAGLREPPGGVLGGLQIAAMVTSAVGLPLGGVLVNAWGWRAAFVINVPLAVLALAMTFVWVPRDRSIQGSRRARDVASRLDVAGIAGFGGAMTALLVFLLSLPGPNWISLGLFIVIGGGLIAWELRACHPFFDVRLLASNLPLTRTYLRFALATFCLYTVLYGVTGWFEASRGMSPQEAGLLLLPTAAIGALVVVPISRRNLVRLPLVISAGSCLVGSAGVMLLTTETPIAWIVAITVIFGITMGTMAIGNQTTLYTQVTASQIGTASGLFRTFGYLGSIGSSAIIAVAFQSHVGDPGLHSMALIMVGVSVGALLMTLADRQLMTQTRARRAAPARTTRGPAASPDTRAASLHRNPPPPGGLTREKGTSMPLTTLDEKPALVEIDRRKRTR